MSHDYESVFGKGEPVLYKPSLKKVILEALHVSGGGHFGGSLSVIDILDVLYGDILRDAGGISRDRIVLSKGHAAIALYAVLARENKIEWSDLGSYGRFASRLQGHPDMTSLSCLDFSTGSLGQGLSVALGMAIALQSRGSEFGAWVILGDGECQEGQVWEAAALAERLEVNNLWAIVDCNGHQEYGWRRERSDPLLNPAAKWEAFGWNVLTCDGHDKSKLIDAMRSMQRFSGPSILLAHTVKGSGFELLERSPDQYHCASFGTEEFQDVMASEKKA